MPHSTQQQPRTGLVLDPRFTDHDTGPGHPEQPARLRAIADALEQHNLLSKLHRITGYEPATRQILLTLHTPDYLDRLDDACVAHRTYIDTQDSRIGPDSADIAKLAVGSVLHAADAIMQGQLTNAFCAVRPPGHHAEAHRSMGFCLYANVALAAHHLLTTHQLERVAIVDFDVHHGNGTQHLLEQRSDALVISIHEDPNTQYPHTGFADETGVGQGLGYTLNLPMPPGSNDQDYHHAFTQNIVPRLLDYQPQFLLLSAGFDAHTLDPLGHIDLTTAGYAHLTQLITAVAQQTCHGRILSVLEGGYHLQALADSTTAHVQQLIQAASRVGQWSA